MRLETLAVSKLMERMVNNGASLEELKKVADYMVTAAVGFLCPCGQRRRCGLPQRFGLFWGSSGFPIKEITD